MDRPKNNPWARTLLGLLLLASLVLCSAADPEQLAQLDRLQEMLEDRQWEAVATEAEALLADHPDNAAIRAKFGLALLGKARTEEQVLDEAKADQLKSATDPAAFFDPALFRTEVTFDDGLWGQAREEFERVLARSSDNLDARVGLASIYGRAGDPAQEREQIRLAARAHADDQEAGRLLLRFGEKYFAAGGYEDALAIFGILMESFGADPTVALDYGAAQFANSQYDAGIATLEKASGLDPDSENLSQTLAQMYIFRMYWEEAAAVYQRLGEQFPDNPMITVQHGASLLPESLQRGRVLLQQVVQADPEKGTPAAAVAGNLLLGLDEGATPDLVQLADDLNSRRLPHLAATVGGVLLVREPDSVAGRLVFAAIYDGLQYFDLSLLMLRDAAKVIGENPQASAPFTRDDVIASQGRTHFRMGNHQKAVDAFLSADDPRKFHLALGLGYEKLGDSRKAFDYFTQVVEGGGTGPQLVRASEHLARQEYSGFQKDQ